MNLYVPYDDATSEKAAIRAEMISQIVNKSINREIMCSYLLINDQLFFSSRTPSTSTLSAGKIS